MAEQLESLLGLDAQKPVSSVRGSLLGGQKPATRQFPAQMVPAQAKIIAVQFSHADLQQLLINRLYQEAVWLKEFKRGMLKNNPDGSYTVEFYK